MQQPTITQRKYRMECWPGEALSWAWIDLRRESLICRRAGAIGVALVQFLSRKQAAEG